MQLRNEHHTFTGMQRDTSPLRQPSSFLYNAKNIRLTPRGDDTMYAITNEKGTVPTSIVLTGTYLGHCLLNEFLVIFTHDTDVEPNAEQGTKPNDYIYRINLDTEECDTLYGGESLGFDTNYPIKAIGSYENKNIQKVYWTDGFNQPRLINIAPSNDDNISSYTSKSFDFIPSLQLNEKVYITKQYGTSGEFPAGVIQYAFTYFNRYKQESNIFYTSKLFAVAPYDRGGRPDEKVGVSFKLELEDLDANFECLRIYSILRTSLNATPIVKRVQDLPIKEGSIDYPDIYSGETKVAKGFFISRVSVDGGETFVSPSDLSLHTDWYYTNPFYIDGAYKPTPDIHTHNGWDMIRHNGHSTYYLFTKEECPNLIVEVKYLNQPTHYYSWEASANNTAVMLLVSSSLHNAFILCEQEVGYNQWATVPFKHYTEIPRIARKVSFIDSNHSGNTIDPTELLYKGGESISAKTMGQKDNTLFLGNINILRSPIENVTEILRELFALPTNPDTGKTEIGWETDYNAGSITARLRSVGPVTEGNPVNTGRMYYANFIDISGFKCQEIYRFGIQFQHITGKWSDPMWLRDYKINYLPSVNTHYIVLPQIEVTITNENMMTLLHNANYVRARLLMAQPTNADRTILCQGIGNPTVFTYHRRYGTDHDTVNEYVEEEATGTLYAQSSWLFRPKWDGSAAEGKTEATQAGGYIPHGIIYDFNAGHISGISWTNPSNNETEMLGSPGLWSTEIGCPLKFSNQFNTDSTLITLHTPELIFDTSLYLENWEGTYLQKVGEVQFTQCWGDIDIQTSSPTIGSATGFLHHSVWTGGNAALISGLFYKDLIVDDDVWDSGNFGAYPRLKVPVTWPVFMWHHSGSLNNDINRSGASSVLSKKKISNYRIDNTASYCTIDQQSPWYINGKPVLFNSDEVSIVKVDNHIYMGNVDTSLVPDERAPKYFAVKNLQGSNDDTSVHSTLRNRLTLKNADDVNSQGYIQGLNNSQGWIQSGSDPYDIGDAYNALAYSIDPIRMKYKSTPHLVIQLSNDIYSNLGNSRLPFFEVRREYNSATLYGGVSDDALQSNVWIPISEPVKFDNYHISIVSNRGDTWYQRFDCLKTYAFTPEDPNQVVDIASFMVESHVNMDGRYDRNRGQASNLNMSPQNFNLHNPVYSQLDNFFNYRILDNDYYETNEFSNQITWSKEKQAGSEVDAWTNITLASTYDMDGSKGAIKSLNVWKGTIYCFQDKGISNILFNSRVQIPTSDNVPIEISNSYKVDGYRYISDGIGCSSPQLITDTPSGIYFIDSIGGHMFHIGDNISDISVTHNMTTWFDSSRDLIKDILYDDTHHDVYIVKDNEALCFSEVLGQFTSFFDYGNLPLIETYKSHVFTLKGQRLFKMFEGDYNDFFGVNTTVEGETQYIPNYKTWNFTFISNGVDNSFMDFDKIFTNIDYRMDMSSGNNYQHDKSLDVIRVSTEYQDTGDVTLKRYQQSSGVTDIYPNDKNLEKKFRIWRIQIPRNQNSMDRIRNPWCKITLGNNALNSNKAVLHDLNVQYYM